MRLGECPSWDFALAVYARPGVEAACLGLQARGLVVMVLLHALWLGAAGRGVAPPRRWRAWTAAGRAWEEEVLRPLRAARRAAKADPAGMGAAAVGALRADMLEVELAAERALAGRLGRRLSAARPAEPSRRLADAAANLVGCVAAAGVARDPAVDRALATILAAALPGCARRAAAHALRAVPDAFKAPSCGRAGRTSAPSRSRSSAAR